MNAVREALRGTGLLCRLVVRRDRIVLTAWIVLIVLIGLGTVSYYLGLFADASTRAAFARDVASTPALLAFNGPLFGNGLDVLATWRMRDLSWTLVALMAVLTAVRHTRVEEDAGRSELVGAAVVGRHAALAAATVVATGASVVVAALNALGMAALGLDPVGCLAYAAVTAATGALFAGVGALAAQVASTGRAALGLGVLVLGVSYVVRFVADGSGVVALAWAGPLGWAHQTRPFGDAPFAERWAVPLLTLLVTVVLVGTAHALVARRDLGAGLLPTLPGPARGRIHTTLALAWRLQRGLLIGWTVGFTVAGALFGGLVAAVRATPDALTGSVPLRLFLERYAGASTAGSADVLLWVIALTLGYTAALYPALATLRMREEESSGRADPLLAAPVDRLRWAGGHILIAALGTAVVLTAGGVAAGTVLASSTGDGTRFGAAVAGTLIQVPAAWVLGALTVLAFGLLPRATATVAWAGFLFVQLFELVGPIAGIDFALVEIVIPFWHLPRILSGGEFSAVPLLVLAGISAAAVAVGLAGLRRRDLSG